MRRNNNPLPHLSRTHQSTHMKRTTLLLAGLFLAAAAFAANEDKTAPAPTSMTDKVEKTDAEWQKTLTPEQYRILRKKGTEAPFKNEYANNHEHGIYKCAGCGKELFSSETKFESGTGWPSFYQPIAPEVVRTETDRSWLGFARTEVLCARCGGHLGHVFDDGPKPTGQRYCMNSAAMKFEKQ